MYNLFCQESYFPATPFTQYFVPQSFFSTQRRSKPARWIKYPVWAIPHFYQMEYRSGGAHVLLSMPFRQMSKYTISLEHMHHIYVQLTLG